MLNDVLDTTLLLPSPQLVLEKLGLPVDEQAWYVGDSYVDMLTANRAGVSGVFYNGACWEPDRIDSWFSYRDAPAAILDSFEDLIDLLALLERHRPLRRKSGHGPTRGRNRHSPALSRTGILPWSA